jgi:hypothetical protein
MLSTHVSELDQPAGELGRGFCAGASGADGENNRATLNITRVTKQSKKIDSSRFLQHS